MPSDSITWRAEIEGDYERRVRTPAQAATSVVTDAQKSDILTPDFIAGQTDKLITLLKWIFKGPPFLSKFGLAELLDLPPLKAVAGYLDFFKIHLVILAKILASVKKAEPIGNHIRELEDSIKDYLNETLRVTNKVKQDFPRSPWQNFHPGFAVVLLAPILKQDQKFVQEWNTYLNVYEALIQDTMAMTDYLAQQGRDIERETPQKITELRGEVEKIKASITLDIVIKLNYKKRLDWVELDVMTKVSSAQSAAEQANRILQRALVEGQKAQRL